MKVPFGLSKSSGKFVDVSEVLNGKKCGCKCPSCELDLIARQGTLTDWHFAHDTSNDVDNKYDECEFSFHESVRLMLRNLIAEGDCLTVPEWQLTNQFTQQTVTITKQKTVTYQIFSMDIPTTFLKGLLDAVVVVSDKKLALFISHKGRKLHKNEGSLLDGEGLLEMNIQELDLRHLTLSARECLKLWLEQSPDHKRWVFHAREQKAKAYLNIAEVNSISSMTSKQLMDYCLVKTKDMFRNEKGIDPDLPGWRGWVLLEAEKLFKQYTG